MVSIRGRPSCRREFSAGDKEEQEIAETCIRLIKNAIICWNYLLLEHRLNQVPNDEIKAETQAAVANHSVISWGHANLVQEYDLSDEKLRDSVYIPSPEPYRNCKQEWGTEVCINRGFCVFPGGAKSLYVPLHRDEADYLLQTLTRVKTKPDFTVPDEAEGHRYS